MKYVFSVFFYVFFHFVKFKYKIGEWKLKLMYIRMYTNYPLEKNIKYSQFPGKWGYYFFYAKVKHVALRLHDVISSVTFVNEFLNLSLKSENIWSRSFNKCLHSYCNKTDLTIEVLGQNTLTFPLYFFLYMYLESCTLASWGSIMLWKWGITLNKIH